MWVPPQSWVLLSFWPIRRPVSRDSLVACSSRDTCARATTAPISWPRRPKSVLFLIRTSYCLRGLFSLAFNRINLVPLKLLRSPDYYGPIRPIWLRSCFRELGIGLLNKAFNKSVLQINQFDCSHRAYFIPCTKAHSILSTVYSVGKQARNYITW